MLVTGTINTILTKFQDYTCVENCDCKGTFNSDCTPVYFEQPIWQSLNMFVGEIFCLIVYSIINLFNYYKTRQRDEEERQRLLESDNVMGEAQDNGNDNIGNDDSSVQRHWITNIIFILPTLCDLMASVLMNVGLIYTVASIYQMLKGSIVLFTGIFSVIFLKSKVRWEGLFFVSLGIFVVGLSGVLKNKSEQIDMKFSFIGILLVVSAQILSALQYVIEEKIMHKYKTPALLAVGLEGLFGSIFIALSFPFLLNQDHRFLNVKDGFYQIINNTRLWASGLGIIFSISLFNWFGLLITKNVSSTSRSLVDITRTLFIWLVSLYLEWESFKWLQIVGFTILIYGIFVFNDLVSIRIRIGRSISETQT